MHAAELLGVGFSFTGHANELFSHRVGLASKVRSARFIVCISEFHRQFYLSIGADPARLKVVYCGIDTGRFTGQPALSGVLAVLALRQALLPMRSPGMPALCKALNYRALFIEEITVTATGTVVSVTLAFLTHSVWSIVFGAIAGALSSVIVSYILSRSARARSGTARRPTRLATWAARSSSTPWSWRSGSTPTGSLASASCRWCRWAFTPWRGISPR